jgi:hypothetical protein
VSVLGALSIGFVVGLSIVGAVLLRNEEKIREAWRRRHPDSKAGPAGRGTVVAFGLIAIANVGLAVDSGEALRVLLAAGWLLMFGLSLRRYRRSQGST